MNTIQRYDCGDEHDPSMYTHQDGDVVKFEDHEKIVKVMNDRITESMNYKTYSLGSLSTTHDPRIMVCLL